MKKIFLAIFSIFAFQFLTAQVGSSNNCIIESGKGCGQLQIGAERSSLESIYGKNMEKSKQMGIYTGFDARQKVEEIMFIFAESPYIFSTVTAFYRGGLEKGLSVNSTAEQFINAYGQPKSRTTGTIFGPPTDYLSFDEIDVYFARGKLTHVVVKAGKNTPAPVAGNSDQPMEIELDFGSDKKEEKKEPRTDLDYLKSNIIFGKENIPAAAAAPAPVMDCKYFLDQEKCRNLLFAMTAEEVQKAFGQTEGKQFGMVTTYSYKGMTIDVANTNRVEEVEFRGFSMMDFKLKSPDKEHMPAADINWGDGKGKIISRYGNVSPQKIKGVDGQKYEIYRYDDGHLTFEFTDGKLTMIEIKRKVSDDEYAQMRKNLQREREEAEARKTPAQRARDRAIEEAKEIKYAFDELHERIELYVKEANKITRGMSVTNYNSRARDEKGVSLLKGEIINMIDQFLRTYKGRLPQSVIDHLSHDSQTVTEGGVH